MSSEAFSSEADIGSREEDAPPRGHGALPRRRETEGSPDGAGRSAAPRLSGELRVERLVKAFSSRDQAAVDGVSFTVAPGEICVLLGPSGCGKTTTLRCVAGLEAASDGVVAIAGRPVSDPRQGIFVPPQHRQLGMVFQSYALWPHLTVAQNVAFPLKAKGVPAGKRGPRVAEALAVVGLEGFEGRSVAALSGGQMQRVALARSLIYRPSLLLLDEPLSNLDAELRLRLRDDLRRIIKDAGLTALYVTHDQSEAVALGDRIGVMRNGRLEQLAPPAELYNAPRTLFVATFTGAANLVAATVAARDGGAARVRIGTTEIAARLAPGLGIGDAVRLVVRPENVRLAGRGAGSAGVLPGVIARHRYNGTQSLYAVELLGTVIEAAELGTVPRFAPGAEVDVAFAPDTAWALAAEPSGAGSGT